jgi:hypothetical protein
MPIQHIDGSATLNRPLAAACIASHLLSLDIRPLNNRNRLAILIPANDILKL